jgi:hypothetical protein
MPLSPDHRDLNEAVSAMRSSFNPDGRRDGQALPMAPDIWRRMMRGEITAHEAHREWTEREPGHRAFNDQIRRQAGVGFVADTSQVLGVGAGDPAAVRDAQTGQFADLDEAMRAAAHQPMPGGLVLLSRGRRWTRRGDPRGVSACRRAARGAVMTRDLDLSQLMDDGSASTIYVSGSVANLLVVGLDNVSYSQMISSAEMIVEVAHGRWKAVDRCSDRDRVASALILARVDELAYEVDALMADIQAVLGDEVVLPDWASGQLREMFDTGWKGATPSVVTVRRCRDDLQRWRNELFTADRKAA